MKMKKIALFTALSFALLTGVAQANIHVTSSAKSLKSGDACDQFAGTWSGDGYISADLPWYYGGDLHCHYTGGSSGGITVTNGSSAGTYNVHVDVSSGSGSDYRCPGSETIDLPATCSNGAININSDKANLNGSVAADGTTADLTGTLQFSAAGTTINANVDSLHLTK